MKLATIIIALSAVALVSSDAFAQSNDHFSRQRREASARRNATTQAVQHWGGPTNNIRWYGSTGSQRSSTRVFQQNVQYVPVSPFGNGIGFGVGYPVRTYPSYPRGWGWNPYYGYPRVNAPINHVHIHQIITE